MSRRCTVGSLSVSGRKLWGADTAEDGETGTRHDNALILGAQAKRAQNREHDQSQTGQRRVALSYIDSRTWVTFLWAVSSCSSFFFFQPFFCTLAVNVSLPHWNMTYIQQFTSTKRGSISAHGQLRQTKNGLSINTSNLLLTLSILFIIFHCTVSIRVATFNRLIDYKK